MTSLRLFLLFITLTTTSITVCAQKVDIGASIGGAYYYGDVVNEVTPSTIRPTIGGFIRYHLTSRFAVRANGLYARISGDDRLSTSEWQQERDFRFYTDILEASGVFEFNLIDDRNTGRRIRNPYIPYVFGGVGIFYYRPGTDIFGRDQSLRPLQLSGVAYSEYGVCMPFGIGLRYYAFGNFLIGAEIGLRYTNTSYLDDIGNNDRYVDPASTPFPKATEFVYNRTGANRNPGDYRGKLGLSNFNYNDFYMLGTFTVSYKLGKRLGTKGRSYGGKAIRCPRFY
jgi:hypothetical protein